MEAVFSVKVNVKIMVSKPPDVAEWNGYTNGEPIMIRK